MKGTRHITVFIFCAFLLLLDYATTSQSVNYDNEKKQINNLKERLENVSSDVPEDLKNHLKDTLNLYNNSLNEAQNSLLGQPNISTSTQDSENNTLGVSSNNNLTNQNVATVLNEQECQSIKKIIKDLLNASTNGEDINTPFSTVFKSALDNDELRTSITKLTEALCGHTTNSHNNLRGASQNDSDYLHSVFDKALTHLDSLQ
ncbi:MSP7-like protein [Plasmodium sp. DRC-Itaito]|uniref:MSP7-like protein n=1 Tax=Plasmodium gaboni TaxID=647221 RepID=A0ABY1US33_9APIC|nr:MSP7-like protein [Plasmodium gaboni]SOV24392.1 MSP7-like protein [Plasmodium sp. DRC-Itaito]